MSPVPHVSEAVRHRFIGRSEALDAFYLRFAYRHMKNGVYYFGKGGVGKTWVLKKIILDNQDDPFRTVTDVIDFFDTQNHSIRGLQTAIKSRLQAPEAFQLYDEMIKRLDAARSEESVHPSAIASLESRANSLFIQCCQQAATGREVILLFDTFEQVQQRHVGRWLLQEFLPQVRSPLVAIAGRPEPVPAQMPDNVAAYELKGFSFEDAKEYIRSNYLPQASNEVIEAIWKHTDGAPLIIDLIFDRPISERDEFITQLSRLKDDEKVQDSKDLLPGLVKQFTRPTRRNKIVWAMAYLRLRFNVQMLKYVVENGKKWFKPGDYGEILKELGHSIYIKESPDRQTHLLHDEVQRMVADYLLGEVVDPEREMWESLYGLVVDRYYPQAIAAADPNLARQLRAERLGYILDNDPDAGLQRYEARQREIEDTHDYDLEELLWSEMHDHLDSFGDNAYQICFKRGRWLRKHSLFRKAEEHYRQMVTRFKEKSVDTRQPLGFMLLRQGKISEAWDVFQESRSLVKDDDFGSIAMVENTLGQVARRAGWWDKALEHYAQSFSAAARARDYSHMASVQINRGYLYALQGAYEHAKKQCRQAIELLNSLPESPGNIQRNIYAWMNLGSAYRYSGDYAQAGGNYRTSLELARESNNLEAICDALQHRGINEHLWGRTFRRDLLSRTLRPEPSSQMLSQSQGALNDACEHQLQAWQDLTEALKIAREADWRDGIDDGLHRLAKVYREIYRIQTLLPQLGEGIDIPGALEELQRKGGAYQVPFEVEYEYDLLTPGHFEQLDWMGKAVRLFDLAALVASEVNDFHRALDSLTELSRTFVELGVKEQVPIVLRRVERLKGYDYQEELFAAMNEISRGDLDFMQGRFDSALERYVKAYADIAEQSGYASFLLTDRLRDLRWRLQDLPSEATLHWCDVLESEWRDRLDPSKRPNMMGVLERVRTEIWIQQVEV